MSETAKRKWPWAGAAILIGAFAVIETLNFSGFCYREVRYLSNREFIDRAVRFNLQLHGPSNERKKVYSSLTEFYRLNPNCCILHNWGYPFADPIIVRLVGLYIAVADIVYRTNDAAGVDNFYYSFVFMNACGDVVRDGGEPRASVPNT